MTEVTRILNAIDQGDAQNNWHNDKVWLNDGEGNFADTGQNLHGGHVLGDVDGDGDLDIVGQKVWLNQNPLPGDVTRDGVVNGLDIAPFGDVLLSGQFNAGADVNQDGAVNGLDVDPFVAAVLAGSASTGSASQQSHFESDAAIGPRESDGSVTVATTFSTRESHAPRLRSDFSQS